MPRALQLAKRAGDAELERWVRLELYGYSREGGMTEEDVVPEYRAVAGRWIDRFGHILDLSDYPDLAVVNEYRFRFGAAQLEELAARQDMQNITDDACISALRAVGIEVVRFCFSPIEVRGVLDVIRNKLAEKVSDVLSMSSRTPY